MVFLYMVPERRQMGGAAMEKKKGCRDSSLPVL